MLFLLSITFVAADPQVRFIVNDEVTETLQEGETTRIQQCLLHEVTLLAIDDNANTKIIVNDIVSETFNVTETQYLEDIEVYYREYRPIDYETRVIVNDEVSTNMRSGESLVVNGVEVTVLIIEEDSTGKPQARFIVNDITTQTLFSGQTQELPESIEFTVLAIETIPDSSQAQFEIQKEPTKFLFEGETTEVSVCTSDQELTVVYIDEQNKEVRVLYNEEMSSMLQEGETVMLQGDSVTVLTLEVNEQIAQEQIQQQDSTKAEQESESEAIQKEQTQEEQSKAQEDSDSSDTTQQEQAQSTMCESGCMLEEQCVPIGFRAQINDTTMYCSVTNEFVAQAERGLACQNDFECTTNQCLDGVCKSISEELEETRGLLTRIVSWFSNIFG